MRPRQPSPAALLARIRQLDFTAHSDAGLRDAFKGLLFGSADEARSADVAANTLLPECFAIVAEVIDRRLGVWRLFDDASLADGFGEDAPIVANAMADVVRQRAYRRSGQIMLSAGFYRKARRQDATGQLRFRATDEQLLAGIHLFRGKVVQMDAGEGKTVAAAFPAALHAVMGRQVHVVTANDYLADRDAKMLGPVYESLGLSSGRVLQHTEEGERRQVYRRSIVYGAMRELGFDYLRDNLKSDSAQRVQRGPALSDAVAIVDEADHALIDEAFTPMIISGNPTGGSRVAVRADRAVAEMIRAQQAVARELAEELEAADAKSGGHVQALARLLLADPSTSSGDRSWGDSLALQGRFSANPGSLKRARALAEEPAHDLTSGLYYAVHPGNRFVTLTERGRDFLEQRLGRFYDGGEFGSAEEGAPAAERDLTLPERRRRAGRADRSLSRRYGMGNQVLQSLRAHLLLKRDVDYLVDGDGVALIDQHTGRPKPDNIYQHGLQAAVEAKEGVPVGPDSETLAWISVSGFVSLYGRVSGITGTAATAAGEFRRKYGLEVTVVPPVKPPLRAICSPKVFLSRKDKIAAVLDEVAIRHRMGQPVLAATRTVEQSEELSGELARRGIPHQLLNAVTTHAEARIVRDAGKFGAVTVSTPMAGRGTDIVLEPGLKARLTQHCIEEIHCLLTEKAGAVYVCCPSPEQSDRLRVALEQAGQFDIADRPGVGLRVRLRGDGNPDDDGNRGDVRRVEFALGLCVIGTEIYDSRRVELQLHGRSGRQGEFGLAQTFLSLEDRLVNLDADSILKLPGCRQTAAAGRVYYTGPDVARRIGRLQAAADREGEAQRSLMQDYTAEFDRQTQLYYQRRRQVMESESMPDLGRETARRVASRMAERRLGLDADDDYPRRFAELEEEARVDYGVDCSGLYGTDLALMPAGLLALFIARLERQVSRTGERVYPRVVRLLWLQVCGELWPGHIAGLRDAMASQLLSNLAHKSAVAQYLRRSNESWREFWELAGEEFLSRLTAFPLSAPTEEEPVAVSRETELLLGQAGIHS